MAIFNGGINSWLPAWPSLQAELFEPAESIHDPSPPEPSTVPTQLSHCTDTPSVHASPRSSAPFIDESQDSPSDLVSEQPELVLRKKNSRSSLILSQPNSWLGWVRRESFLEAIPDASLGPAQFPDHVASISVQNGAQAQLEPEIRETVPGVPPSETDSKSAHKPGGKTTDKVCPADALVETQHKRSSSSGWGFWGGGDTSFKPETDAGLLKATAELSNTILNTTPTLLLRPKKSSSESLAEDSKESFADRPDKNKLQATPKNDAVLYKVHDQSTDFNKINTHRNENIRENILVPDWEDCLPRPIRSRYWPLLFSPSTSSRSALHLEKHSWGHLFRSTLDWSRSRLIHSNLDAQDEFKTMRLTPHDLYGLRLNILPPEMRACLPSFDKVYAAPRHLVADASEESQVYGACESRIVSAAPGPSRKIKKILIIGVHGFFPHRVMRSIIGTPQGTSSKFASEAEKAVLRYCEANDLLNGDENNMSIQKIALEKEGDIFDRVDFFTDILSRWQLELNSADFIFVASHSQGCVVAIILIARIICLGILQNPTKKRIGILGMAGINNGPVYGADKSFLMKAYLALENASMLELFEFTNFDSKQSLVYKQSVQMAINANVKLCFVASVNDPLVPLYSALASHIFHPNIFRACYIDYSSQTSGFIQQMVSNCCHLQNMGYSDDGVLRELSTALAGPLTGNGHSKIYNDGKVYDLGLRFFLDTSDIVVPTERSSSDLLSENEMMKCAMIKESQVNLNCDDHDDGSGGGPLHFLRPLDIPSTNRIYVKEYDVGKIGTNASLLPWCVRGLLLSIEKHRSSLKRQYSYKRAMKGNEKVNEEILKLQQSYEDWAPRTKALKELKSRLGGMRTSKL